MTSFTHLGFDVHKDSIAVGMLRPDGVVPDFRMIDNTPEALTKLVRKMGRPEHLVACYEAGPTGYDTYRLLTSLGVRCDVIAPALIPRRPGHRVKTDRIDARNLARLHRAGELTTIRIPTTEEEALRDLVRAREHLKDDRRRAQQRVKSFLLRHGRRFPGGTRGWSKRFDEWVRSQRFDDPAAQLAFRHYLSARDLRTTQLEQIDAELQRAVGQPPLVEPVARMRCLRGIDTLSAATIQAEVCDFRRFGTAPAFMGFTGLVPSEHSSGDREHRGSITKSGNRHLRRVLVEAAWSYRHRPNVSSKLRARMEGQGPDVLAFCWKGQVRLHARFHRVAVRRGRNKAAVAVARELAGFVWALMLDRIET
jgi:transposase